MLKLKVCTHGMIRRLAWINGDPSRQKTFVANRTAEIKSTLPQLHWRHVRSEDNLADLISRGTSLEKLQNYKLWWKGPAWLSGIGGWLQSESQSINLSQGDINIIETEYKSEVNALLSVNESKHVVLYILNSYSSLTKIERILSRILRFTFNCRINKIQRRYDNISRDEIHKANQILILETQRIHFATELSDLKANKQIRSTSKILPLSPFIDKNGFLRVGGRIQRSRATFDTKHPILLPSESRFTRLLFEREHRRTLHAGPQMLLYTIREKYWPLKGRNIARRTVHECRNCFRNNPKTLSQIMGQLPSDRVIPKRPFFVTGIDFAGPITTLLNRGRGRKTTKSYISLFVCFATKAIHLEAVSDLTSSAFLAALRRFVGRRGCPQRIFCDNAINFVGARNELSEIWQAVEKNSREVNDEFLAPNNIEWKFILPSSPHMEGLWEAGVKSCKHHLKRVVSQNLLTFEELITTLVQIEACLNSRPISQLPSTPTDLLPLTPGHFIIGESLIAIADVDVTDTPMNLLDHWQLV